MKQEDRDRRERSVFPIPLPADKRSVFALAVLSVIVSLFVLRGLEKDDASARKSTRLSAKPSKALTDSLSTALKSSAVDFESLVVESIHRRGYVTATVHVALLDRRRENDAGAFSDGRNPATNMYWGALFGMETHFANAAGWRRAYTDNGDGERILRRVVFHQRVSPTPHWRERGVGRAFDLYVLANAWPYSRIVEAMGRPIREAVCGEANTIDVDGSTLVFGGDSALVGYVGQNHMLEGYWDPFAGLEGCAPTQQVGIFYICSRSAVVLHAPIVERGLYSVLFTRSTVTPEAYLVDGMFKALLSGELGDGFISRAASEYSRYQKSVSFPRAKSMLIR